MRLNLREQHVEDLADEAVIREGCLRGLAYAPQHAVPARSAAPAEPENINRAPPLAPLCCTAAIHSSCQPLRVRLLLLISPKIDRAHFSKSLPSRPPALYTSSTLRSLCALCTWKISNFWHYYTCAWLTRETLLRFSWDGSILRKSRLDFPSLRDISRSICESIVKLDGSERLM